MQEFQTSLIRIDKNGEQHEVNGSTEFKNLYKELSFDSCQSNEKLSFLENKLNTVNTKEKERIISENEANQLREYIAVLKEDSEYLSAIGCKIEPIEGNPYLENDETAQGVARENDSILTDENPEEGKKKYKYPFEEYYEKMQANIPNREEINQNQEIINPETKESREAIINALELKPEDLNIFKKLPIIQQNAIITVIIQLDIPRVGEITRQNNFMAPTVKLEELSDGRIKIMRNDTFIIDKSGKIFNRNNEEIDVEQERKKIMEGYQNDNGIYKSTGWPDIPNETDDLNLPEVDLPTLPPLKNEAENQKTTEVADATKKEEAFAKDHNITVQQLRKNLAKNKAGWKNAWKKFNGGEADSYSNSATQQAQDTRTENTQGDQNSRIDSGLQEFPDFEETQETSFESVQIQEVIDQYSQTFQSYGFDKRDHEDTYPEGVTFTQSNYPNMELRFSKEMTLDPNRKTKVHATVFVEDKNPDTPSPLDFGNVANYIPQYSPQDQQKIRQAENVLRRLNNQLGTDIQLVKAEPRVDVIMTGIDSLSNMDTAIVRHDGDVTITNNGPYYPVEAAFKEETISGPYAEYETLPGGGRRYNNYPRGTTTVSTGSGTATVSAPAGSKVTISSNGVSSQTGGSGKTFAINSVIIN